jgi:hypothetical protein
MSDTPRATAARSESPAAQATEDGRAVVSEGHLTEIIEALRATRNGYVQIIVQDGRVVQIDRMEKRRLR